MAKRGVSLLDLFAPGGAQGLLPADVASRLENLAVIDLHSTTSGGTFVHEGVVQPLSDLGLPALRNWPVEVPGLNTGLPFRLVRIRRASAPTDTLEPAADAAFLDLIVDRIAITIPGLRPATLVPATSSSPAHLLPDGSRDGVKLVGSGVMRIDLTGAAEVVRFVDFPDPFDPEAPNGPVGRLTFDPISFTFGDSDIGMVVDRVVYDASEQITPPEIIARGQTPGWQGMAIAEATVMLPLKGTAVEQINASVKDVILGSPAGMQGTVSVELGRTPIAGAAVLFTQDVEGTEHPRSPEGSGRELTVPFVADTGATARMRARLSDAVQGQPTQPRISWTLPDSTRVEEPDTGWFATSVGETMNGVYSELVDGERHHDLPISYTFTQDDDGVDHAAMVDAVLPGAPGIANVVSLSGTRDAIAQVELQSRLAVPDAAHIRWQLGTGAGAQTGTGHDFTVFPEEVGTAYLVVTDGELTRRVRIDTLAVGGLLVGAEDGVHDATGALVTVRGVDTTHALAPFHRSGELRSHREDATASGTTVTVPDGGLAAVTVEVGHGVDPTAPPPSVEEAAVRHLSVRFGFNAADPEGWGRFAPNNASGHVSVEIRDWASYFPGARFLVVGHCCDIGTNDQNNRLAGERIASITQHLPAGQVDARGEQEAATGSVALTQGSVPLSEMSATERAAGRTILLDHNTTARQAWGSLTTHPVRESYRRVDIYAVDGTYTPPAGAPGQGQQASTEPQTTDPSLRRSYVPGADAAEIEAPGDPSSRLGYLVRLSVSWDSPTVTSWADAVPTLAEFTLAWSSDHVTMTDENDNETDVPVSSPSTPGTPSTEVWTITGRWAYDNRSGQTLFSLSVASEGDPEGIARFDSSFLAVALALAPALLGGIGGGGAADGVVQMSALAIASAVMTAITTEGWIVLHAISAEYRAPSIDSARGMRLRVTIDYTAAVGIDISADGIGSITTADGHPLKVRYTKVGLEYDDAATEWYDKVGFVFEDVSFEVSDPGRWQIEGPLGDLLAITGTRAGSGSSWFECDLEFALDLGVVSIEGATIRVIFDGGGVSAELRGLALAVEIPGVLRGSGQVVIGDGGAFGASLELELVSVGAKGIGALEFDPANDYLSIQLGLLLPVGIPLGATGLGIFGFLGMFVSNGARQLPAGFENDPVGREIAWYRNAPLLDKFGPERGQWAIGLGMVIGTMPDQAFTFNAVGMLVVAFPDPEVILAIDAKLATRPDLEPKAQGSAPGSGLEILGLVVIDDTAVLVGIRGRYEIPKVLTLNVPIDGYFPYPSTPKDAFVRVGSDGVVAEGRGGDPVQIILLPETLDIEAYAFLMIEEKKLHRLGGDPRFSFDGFSIGFGAGIEIGWSAGPFTLAAGARILVGLGTNPFLLKGMFQVWGTLSLVIVEVDIDGELICTVWDEGGLKVNLQGRFCGRVSFFFFSVSGCVGIEIGDSLTPAAPPPPPPIGKVSLTDRRGQTTAEAITGAPGPGQTVWPDTVPVIELMHHMSVDLSGSAFAPGAPPPGPVWSGTSEMKYAYRLVGVEIVPDGGTALGGPLASGWWLPTHRPGVLADGDVSVSAEEAMFLALMSWDPAPWTYWLTDGGEGTDGNPSQTPGRLCEEPPRPTRMCLLGRDAQRTGTDAVLLPPETLGSPPFPSRFTGHARERIAGRVLELAAPWLVQQGLSLTPGHFADDVWWLAAATRFGFTERTTELRVTLAPEVVEPELRLIVCDDRRKRPQQPVPGTCAIVGDYHRADTVLGTSSSIDGVKIQSHGEPFTTHGEPVTVLLPEAGMVAYLPAITDRVEVRFRMWDNGEAKLVALDSSGGFVADGWVVPDGGWEQTVVLTGSGIASVEMRGATWLGVERVCWGTEGPEPVGSSGLPRVTGSLVGGGEWEWEPEVEQTYRTGTGTCAVVVYRPRETGTWRGVRVHEWAGGRTRPARVGWQRLCGTSASAQALADANAAYALGLAELINGLGGGGGSGPQPPHRSLLAAGTGYSVRIRWQWQGWVKSESKPAPDAVPGSGDWQDGPDVVRRFRTASQATLTGQPPTELTDETTFDPRSILRYLLAFEPDTGQAPHLLDDTLLVHLAVDHLDQLAALYGRAVSLRLRRTDPPPGSLAGQPHAPDEALIVTWTALHDHYRPLGQKLFLEAIREAPCLTEPPLGGTTGEVTADLVPGAWYDLMLMATPAAQPASEELVVRRAHFQASAYRDATELLAALGLTATESPLVAPDAVVSGPVPPGPLVVGDRELDEAMVALGLDPWPLPVAGRTSVLWWRQGASWLLAGVLLELPEPIVRTGRRALDVTAASHGGVPLLQRRRNSNGTRVLLAPTAPVAVSPSGTDDFQAGPLVVQLTRTVTDRTGSTSSTVVTGSRSALTAPRAVYQEVGA
ncbi:hypothetical protein [Ornithinimicrobium cavernae]|uniref:hypothetical protein n=1 Tax=Ornithinimicrobium cavernae TaxID=2666047 RepID=UPI000D686528|nr:hypothetical protein [Ornithinimicrobium cavernae]